MLCVECFRSEPDREKRASVLRRQSKFTDGISEAHRECSVHARKPVIPQSHSVAARPVAARASGEGAGVVAACGSAVLVIAVIVPAHDEEDYIGACLSSLRMAANSSRLAGEPVMLIVALDACTDRTALIARRLGAATLELDVRNVGIARARGAELALEAGARWLAFTDADTVVTPDWLAIQIALGVDAVVGTVAVDDWGAYGHAMQRHFEATYTDADGHRHIHGANLGVSAEAYRRAGGFEPLASSEDVALVVALQASGASIAWSAAPRVVTSARRAFRAPGGFGATLANVGLTFEVAGAAG